MIFLALLLAAQKSAIDVPGFNTWKGAAWAGVELGAGEAEVKKKFATSKSAIADPASFRLNANRRDVIVSALVSQQGGKGDVVGFVVEGERDAAVASLAALEQELGEPEEVRYPDVRFGDWSVASWKSKGIAAVIRGGQDARVYKVLMASPETLSRRIGTWGSRPTPIANEPRVEIGGIDTSIRLDPTDRELEATVRRYLDANWRRWLDDYRGTGWVAGRGSNRISLKLDLISKRERVVRAAATVHADTPFGSVSGSASAQQVVRNDLEAGLYMAEVIQDALGHLGGSLEEQIRRPVWQAEWRPFYSLARG